MTDEESRFQHSAGATHRHSSPFENLEVAARREMPPADVVERWVKPLYMLNPQWDSSTFVQVFLPRLSEISEPIAADLLSYYNWRPRIVGAYLVAIRRFRDLEQTVGRLLLRSDLACVGAGYCLALARLNTPSAVRFLCDYLDYYLTRADLWFDQGAAMAALGYLDQQNGTSHRALYATRWDGFIANKPSWNLDHDDQGFHNAMDAFRRLDSEPVLPRT